MSDLFKQLDILIDAGVHIKYVGAQRYKIIGQKTWYTVVTYPETHLVTVLDSNGKEKDSIKPHKLAYYIIKAHHTSWEKEIKHSNVYYEPYKEWRYLYNMNQLPHKVGLTF